MNFAKHDGLLRIYCLTIATQLRDSYCKLMFLMSVLQPRFVLFLFNIILRSYNNLKEKYNKFLNVTLCLGTFVTSVRRPSRARRRTASADNPTMKPGTICTIYYVKYGCWE